MGERTDDATVIKRYLAFLAVGPLIGVLALALPLLTSSQAERVSLRAAVDDADRETVADLAGALANERGLTLLLAESRDARLRTRVAEARARVDQAIASIEGGGALDLADALPTAPLEGLRVAVDALKVDAMTSFVQYSGLVEALAGRVQGDPREPELSKASECLVEGGAELGARRALAARAALAAETPDRPSWSVAARIRWCVDGLPGVVVPPGLHTLADDPAPVGATGDPIESALRVFDVHTRAIDRLAEVRRDFDTKLRSALAGRADQADRRFWILLLIAIALASVGPFVSVGIARRTMRQVKRVDATRRAAEIARETADQALTERNHVLGMAAHDLRNPLAAITGFARLLEHKLQDEGDVYMTKRINKSAQFMLDLVNELLDVSAIQSGKVTLHRQNTDIAALIDDTCVLLRPLARQKSIALEWECATAMAYVDENKVTQVLHNLVTNAIKYSHPDTSVHISVSPEQNGWRIEVRDQGQGIAEDELGSLFAPFSKASARPTAGEASTGLGLAIAKRIVDVHGGRIGVESQVGTGSKFWVWLPRGLRRDDADPSSA